MLLKRGLEIGSANMIKLGLPTVPECPGQSRNCRLASRAPGRATSVPQFTDNQGCRSLLCGGNNLQFYPNFALFSTLGG